MSPPFNATTAPPFMSDARLCDTIDRLTDAEAVAESIWFILDQDSASNTMSARAETARRLGLALQNTIKASLEDLAAIHEEWMRRWVEAGAPGTSDDCR